MARAKYASFVCDIMETNALLNQENGTGGTIIQCKGRATNEQGVKGF